MDKPVGEQTVQAKESRLEKRRRARDRARIFLPLILSAWELMPKLSKQKAMLIPLSNNEKENELSGAVFKAGELKAALKMAKQTERVI